MGDKNIISVYSLEQAVEDGFIVEVFKNRWQKLSHGKPIVATAHLFNEVSSAGLMEVWNEFVKWRANAKAIAAPVITDWLFETKMNGKKVWLIEDGDAFTMMYPEDY